MATQETARARKRRLKQKALRQRLYRKRHAKEVAAYQRRYYPEYYRKNRERLLDYGKRYKAKKKAAAKR